MERAGTDSETSRRAPVTAVVCTRNRPEYLPQCLTSIAEAMGPEDELIVVESGDSAARQALEDLPPGVRRRLIESVDRRKTVKLNLAARASTSGVLVLTDDDCRVAPGWLDGMARPFVEDKVGIAFGPVSGLDSLPGGTAAPVIPPGPAPIENWNYAHGASMAVRRGAVVDVGGFDERLGPGARTHGEEADMILRMSEAGWRCAIADAPPVRHLAWRDDEQTRQNLAVYERGAGAWLGAGMRRSPMRTAKLLTLRLMYQAELWKDRRTRGTSFGPRMTAAFLGGLARGLTYRPRRWL